MSRAARLRALVVVLALVLLVPSTTLAAPSAPNRVYFPQTGHYLAYGFLNYWLQHGGIPIFGYPISEEMQQSGLTVQYFERAVFEYHPANPPAWRVQLRRLGADTTASQAGTGPFAPWGTISGGMSTSSCDFYQLTGHAVCNGFRSYWRTYGGLPVFGYPISDEFKQNGVTVQYFERARFEWHPGAWPSRFDVLLGLLGNQAAQQDGVSTAPLAQSPAVPVFDLSLWPRCDTPGLQAGTGFSSGAAGHILAVFTLRNTASSTCTLYGYPGLQLLDASGNPLPTTVHRPPDVSVFAILNVPPQLVFLTPGDTASFDAGWGHIPSGAMACPTSAQLEITPPDAFTQLVIPARIDACNGDLYVSPVVLGSGGVPY